MSKYFEFFYEHKTRCKIAYALSLIVIFICCFIMMSYVQEEIKWASQIICLINLFNIEALEAIS